MLVLAAVVAFMLLQGGMRNFGKWNFIVEAQFPHSKLGICSSNHLEWSTDDT